MLRAVILKLQPSSVSPGGLVNTLFAGLLFRATDSGDLGQGLRSCISYKFWVMLMLVWELVVVHTLRATGLKLANCGRAGLFSIVSCIRNRLHLFVYMVTGCFHDTVAEMALKHNIFVWSLKKNLFNSFLLKMCSKYFLLCSCFSSSLCIKKSWRSGFLQDEAPELRSPIKEKKRFADSGFPADSSLFHSMPRLAL